MPLHTVRLPVTSHRRSRLILPSLEISVQFLVLPRCKNSIKNYRVVIARTQQEAILMHVDHFYISVCLLVVSKNSTTLFLWSDSKGHIETHSLSNTCTATYINHFKNLLYSTSSTDYNTLVYGQMNMRRSSVSLRQWKCCDVPFRCKISTLILNYLPQISRQHSLCKEQYSEKLTRILLPLGVIGLFSMLSTNRVSKKEKAVSQTVFITWLLTVHWSPFWCNTVFWCGQQGPSFLWYTMLCVLGTSLCGGLAGAGTVSALIDIHAVGRALSQILRPTAAPPTALGTSQSMKASWKVFWYWLVM